MFGHTNGIVVLYILLKVLVLHFPNYCKGADFIRRALKSNYFELCVCNIVYMLRHIELKVVALQTYD